MEIRRRHSFRTGDLSVAAMEERNGGIVSVERDLAMASSSIAAAECVSRSKSLWRHAIYEEKIKQLEKEKNVYVQKEAILEENIKQLLSEKSETLQKESKVEERIRQLENEKFMHIQAALKEMVSIGCYHNEKAKNHIPSSNGN
nr:uncharacterized protein LOC109181594 isoform X2 [Ipomoea trifida]